jgi:hypothetical protein
MFTPSYFVMESLISNLLRIRKREAENLSFHHRSILVLSHQVERKWSEHLDGLCWSPIRELKVLVDKGLAYLNPETCEMTPTSSFDSLASQLLDSNDDETDEELLELIETQLTHPEEVVSHYTDGVETFRSFEANNDGSFRLRVEHWEPEPCYCCMDFGCPGPYYCD